MMMPPVRPARKRQAKNQMNDTGDRAGKEREGGEHHHRAQRRAAPKRVPRSPRQQRAGEIAGEIGGAEIDDIGRR